VADPATGDDERQVWRIPPALPALTLLVVSAMAAINIYGRPTTPVRVFTVGLGLVCLLTAIAWLRMYLVVDHEGIALRHLTAESWLPWSDIARVEVVSAAKVFAGVSSSNTIRIVRHDASYVDVPPSLTQPAKPTGKRKAAALLDQVAREIETFRVP
jgi:Bacterial PH domain